MKEAWKEAVVYQLYPLSFMDGNGDGIGDLKGILSRVDYLKELGINMVWLGPVCQSPMIDHGYDVSHYRRIADQFGTMEEMEALIEELHKRGIKLLMDLVINHTSDEHPWFEQSRSSKDNPYRDYYIWREPKEDGSPPNDWQSFSGESAWRFDEQTGEYYFHIFDEKQPDLNWENEKLRSEIYDMVRFWLDKGIDGFRLDAINHLSKDPSFPDAADDRESPRGQKYFKNGPRMHEYLQELNREAFGRYPGIVTIGEAPSVTMEEVNRYTAQDRGEMTMVLMMEMSRLDAKPGDRWGRAEWKLTRLKQIVDKWYKGVFGKGGYATYLSNHDYPRSLPRYGDDGVYRKESAKMLATFLLTAPGTPIIYQGEELGMTNAKFESIDDYRDKKTRSYYHRRVEREGADPMDALTAIHQCSKDSSRTPMQWNDSPNAGFTTGQPWIPVNPNYPDIHAEEAMADPDSIFHYYRKLIRLRKKEPVLAYGDFRLVDEEHEQVFCYTRQLENTKFVTILNFSDEKAEFNLPKDIREGLKDAEYILSNLPEGGAVLGEKPGKEDRAVLNLAPYEAIVWKLKVNA
ncbi:glucohydrolase [Paenibacillus sp. CAA11]|uniref:glycoside hydrolase family 13 protein n=1 Tax=Paenibacillus sp. CAA11 TaxID=1532905 RepID=UPI000D3C838E|nr:alpha-glucosidase [Paenibacillus sp. CAA11]AWB43576.1 glucohydrolase [Paenibacillus sp. CAA11]